MENRIDLGAFLSQHMEDEVFVFSLNCETLLFSGKGETIYYTIGSKFRGMKVVEYYELIHHNLNKHEIDVEIDFNLL